LYNDLPEIVVESAMASVKVEAKLGIVRYMPGEKTPAEVDIGDGEKVGPLLARLGIPEKSVALILVNQEAADAGTVLKDGDVLALLPLIVGG
jgi:sulfur carrier protein ThiS